VLLAVDSEHIFARLARSINNVGLVPLTVGRR